MKMIRQKIPERLFSLWPLVLLVSLVAIAYRGALDCFFALDDLGWFNTAQSFNKLSDIFNVFIKYNGAGNYRPLTQEIYFFINYKLFGFNSVAFHLVNLLVHLVNTILVYVILIKLGRSKESGWFGALFYGLNSALFISVYWISGITESGMALFYFLAVLTMVMYLKNQHRIYLWGSVFLTILALMAKESAITLPLIFLLLFFYTYPGFNRNNLKKVFRIIWPHLLIVLSYFSVQFVTANIPQGGPYAAKFNSTIFVNLGKFILWSMNRLDNLMAALSSRDYFLTSLYILGIGLSVFGLGFLIVKFRKDALFTGLWFIIALFPFLPFINHPQTYYVNISLLGLGFGIAAVFDGLKAIQLKRYWVLLFEVLFLTMYLLVSLKTISKEHDNSWVISRGNLVKSALKVVQSSYPRIPKNAQIFFFCLDGDASSANFGGVLRAFYRNPRLQVYYSSTLSPDYFGKDHYVFQYSDGKLVDITNNKKLAEAITQTQSTKQEIKSQVLFSTSLDDEKQLGSGWYPPESSLRWMSRNADLILRNPNPSEFSHQLLIKGTTVLKYFPKHQVKMSLIINQNKIYEKTFNTEGAFRIMIPVHQKLPEICRLEIKLDHSFVLKDINNPNQTRELGMAWKKIVLY